MPTGGGLFAREAWGTMAVSDTRKYPTVSVETHMFSPEPYDVVAMFQTSNCRNASNRSRQLARPLPASVRGFNGG